MTTAGHEPVMDLIRAGLDPASHQEGTHRPLELPTGRVVAAAAQADVDSGGMEHISSLAAGVTMAATGLTMELAERHGQQPEQFLDSMDDTARSLFNSAQGTEVSRTMRAMLESQAAAGEALGRLFARDQAQLLDLLVEFGAYCGTCIMILQRRYEVPKDETLQDLEELLKATGTQA